MKRRIAFLGLVGASVIWMAQDRDVESSAGLSPEASTPVSNRHDQNSATKSASASGSGKAKTAIDSDAQSSISLLDDPMGLAPKLVFESRTGKGPQEIGVGGEEQDPRGPVAMAVSASGRLAVADGFNRRIQFRDSNGRVLRNVEFPQDTTLRHVTAGADGRFHSLETNGQGQVLLRSFSESGDAVSTVRIKTKDSFVTYAVNAYRLEVGTSGVANLVGAEESYRVQADGQIRKLPGVPFENDESRFVRIDASASGRRALSIVDAKGRVQKSLPLNNDYQSIAAIHTDAQNRAYVQYDTILRSEPVEAGGAPIRSRVAVVERYSASGVQTGQLMVDLDGTHEIDNPITIDPKTGDAFFASARKESVNMSQVPFNGT